MNNKFVIGWITYTLLIIAICTLISWPPKKVSMVTETFQVENANQLAKHINSLFDKQWVGKAHPIDNKTLLVKMPEEYRRGVSRLIKKSKQEKNDKMVELDFWIVRATKEPIGLNKEAPFRERIIGLLKKEDPNSEFEILEHYKGRALTEHRLKMEGWLAEISSHPRNHRDSNKVNLQIKVDSQMGEVDSHIQLENKKLTLFSQNAVHRKKIQRIFEDKSFSTNAETKKHNRSENIYYVLRGNILQ